MSGESVKEWLRQRQEWWRWHHMSGSPWNSAIALLFRNLYFSRGCFWGHRTGTSDPLPREISVPLQLFCKPLGFRECQTFFPMEMLCVVLITVLSSAVFLGCLSFLPFVCLFLPRPRSFSFCPLNMLFQEVPILLLCPISSRGPSHPDPCSGLPLPVKSVWTVIPHAVATLFEPVAMMGGSRVPQGTASFYLQGTHCLEFLVVGFHFTTLFCRWYVLSLSSGGGGSFLPYGWLLKSVPIC